MTASLTSVSCVVGRRTAQTRRTWEDYGWEQSQNRRSSAQTC